MLEVLGFSVQPSGTESENGPSATRPSARFSSVRGAVCAAIGGVPCALGAAAPGAAEPAPWGLAEPVPGAAGDGVAAGEGALAEGAGAGSFLQAAASSAAAI